MTELRTKGADARLRGSNRDLVTSVLAAALALLPLFFVTGLLAQSIVEYQSYTASIAEFGDTAAMNAEEERGNIVMASLVLAGLWFFLTGLAVAYSAMTKGRVLQTAVRVGGGVAVVVGVMLLVWLTVGTA